jgi:hypothetical protein
LQTTGINLDHSFVNRKRWIAVIINDSRFRNSGLAGVENEKVLCCCNSLRSLHIPFSDAGGLPDEDALADWQIRSILS